MKYCLSFLFACCILCYGCEIKVKPIALDEKNEQPATNNSKIRNGIELKASGLKVEQAFLLFEDGLLVPDDNKIKVNEYVDLRLIVSDWKVENGKVYPGASEKITTSEGDVLIDEADLFTEYKNDGLTPEEAEYLTLSARITLVNKLYDYFLVSFRVWDKKGNGVVTGSYKLYLK